MDETQTPTEMKQEASDTATLPPASSDTPAVASESHPPVSQGAHYNLSFVPINFQQVVASKLSRTLT